MGEGGAVPDSTICSTIGLTEAEVIAANLAALGIKEMPESKDDRLDRLFSFAVEFAKREGRLASSTEIARGCDTSQALAHKDLCDLAERGRMKRVGSGSTSRFLPLVA